MTKNVNQVKLKNIYSMKIISFFQIIVLCFFAFTNVDAKNSKSFEKGKKLFEKSEFEDSKIFFERDIVFNPKNYKSYLYLAKIYKNVEDDSIEEMNLQSVLLLNPDHDEALYLLILLKIKQSDYSAAKDLIKKFDLVCDLFCYKKPEIEEKFAKLIPENENK